MNYISASEVLNMSLRDEIEEASGLRPVPWPEHVITHVNDEIGKTNDQLGDDVGLKGDAREEVITDLREWVKENVWVVPPPYAEADEAAAAESEHEEEGE